MTEKKITSCFGEVRADARLFIHPSPVFSSFLLIFSFLKQNFVIFVNFLITAESSVSKSALILYKLDWISEALESKDTAEAALAEAVEKLVDDNTVSADRPGRGDAEPIYHIPDLCRDFFLYRLRRFRSAP